MIKLDYDFINADIDPSLSKHIKTTDLAFAYKYNDLHFSANGSYDLQENAFFENKYSFGFSYGFGIIYYRKTLKNKTLIKYLYPPFIMMSAHE